MNKLPISFLSQRFFWLVTKIMPKFEIAVLIPSFKPGEYLDRLLDSLENQTLSKERFCVYIGLNGPRMPYEENVLRYLDRKSIKHRFLYIEEIGVSHARNVLLDNSVEPFVTFVDDDDVVSNNFLENLLAVSSEEVVGVSNVCNFEKAISEMKFNYIGNSFRTLNDFEASKFKARKFFSSACAKLIHRQMIGGLRFDASLSKGEDALFMAQASPRIKGVRKSASNTYYYVFERAGSASRKNVAFQPELHRVFYIVKRYLSLLFDKRYEKFFVMSRIVATLLQMKKLVFSRPYQSEIGK